MVCWCVVFSDSGLFCSLLFWPFLYFFEEEKVSKQEQKRTEQHAIQENLKKKKPKNHVYPQPRHSGAVLSEGIKSLGASPTVLVVDDPSGEAWVALFSVLCLLFFARFLVLGVLWAFPGLVSTKAVNRVLDGEVHGDNLRLLLEGHRLRSYVSRALAAAILNLPDGLATARKWLKT